MSVTVNFGGESYNLPQNREPKGWGTQLSAFLQAVAAKALVTTGGALTLTADLDLGTNFGIIAPYFKSASADIATAGILRLANNEGIGWRNAANDANLILKVDASNNLEFNGNDLPTSGSKLSFFAATSSSELAGVISDETGSGALVFANTPTLVTPVLGVATATSINKLTITPPATGSTLTIADGKTLTLSNTLTFTGTDSSSVAFGAGGTVAYVANKLSVFAATSSLELIGVISDETGSGSLVFGTSPTIATPSITGGETWNNISTPSNPAAGSLKFYAKSDKPTYLDSSGNERVVANTSDSLTNPMTTLGDMIGGGAAGAAARIVGNTTNNRKFVRSKGSAGAATAPTIESITSADIAGLNAAQATAHTLTYESPTDVYITSPAGAINQDLPTTNVLAGQMFRLIVSGATVVNTVTLRSSAGNTIDLLKGTGFILVQALQDTPTSAAHWKIIDVYDSGSWTPVYQGTSGSAGAAAYTSFGTYVRQNRVVSIGGFVLLSNKGSWTGVMQIAGLPFTSNANYNAAIGVSQWVALTTALVYLTGLVNTSGTVFQFIRAAAAATSTADLSVADISNTTRIDFSGEYMS